MQRRWPFPRYGHRRPSWSFMATGQSIPILRLGILFHGPFSGLRLLLLFFHFVLGIVIYFFGDVFAFLVVHSHAFFPDSSEIKTACPLLPSNVPSEHAHTLRNPPDTDSRVEEARVHKDKNASILFFCFSWKHPFLEVQIWLSRPHFLSSRTHSPL